MNLLSILKIIIEPNRSYNVFNDDKENSFNSSIFSTLILLLFLKKIAI